jgi:hypothetical protein
MSSMSGGLGLPTRKQLVAELKARKVNGLSDDVRASSTAGGPIRITLPFTCALIPCDYCLLMGLYSCHRCDLYRTVMNADGTYKGKSQQEFSHRYACLYPTRTVLLGVPDAIARSSQFSSPTSAQEDSQPGSHESQSSLSSYGSTSTRQSRRKRNQPITYTVPDSDESDDSVVVEDNQHPFDRLLNHVVPRPSKQQRTAKDARAGTKDASAGTKDANVGTHNGAPVEQSTQTLVTSANIIPTFARWTKASGKDLERRLGKAIKDEQNKDLHNGSKSKRKINLEVMGAVLWSVVHFGYVTRLLKTRANAIVFCLFRHLCQWKPELFEEAILVESRQFLRRHVFQPWKFQKSIDTNAAGGLNYEACNSIRTDVEELSERTIGVIFTPWYNHCQICQATGKACDNITWTDNQH